jgi:2-deoxy-D-gluconate 3-dehydrogenase
LFQLDGKVAVVTGASSGLGRRFCVTLADAGAKVVALGRRRTELDETARLVRASGGTCEVIVADVTDVAGLRAAMKMAVSQLGSIDILVNNAGVGGRAALIDVDEAHVDRVFGTNMRGLLFAAQAAARQMIASGRGGRIINVASIGAEINMGGLGVYSASKAAVIHLTRTMAYEWARYRINVNAISPGYILTDLSRAYLESDAGRACIERLPKRRVGEPAHLDGALLLFASEASDFLTGAVCTADDAQRFVLS